MVEVEDIKKYNIDEMGDELVDELNEISQDISSFISLTINKYKMSYDKSYIFFDLLKKYGEMSKKEVSGSMKNTISDNEYIISHLLKGSEFQTVKKKKVKEE